MTHTPGPWVVGEPHPTNACAYVRAAGAHRGQEVATLFYCSEGGAIGSDGIWPDQPNRDANARLIAAAPDMLEALIMMTDLVDDLLVQAGANYADELAAARAAIAKAKGATQ